MAVVLRDGGLSGGRGGVVAEITAVDGPQAPAEDVKDEVDWLGSVLGARLRHDAEPALSHRALSCASRVCLLA